MTKSPAEDQASGWDEVSDEDLLAEVHRRFGETWCSFSSGVRSREECPVCHRTDQLTRHHLVPVAEGAGKSLSLRRRYVRLCRACHDLAHALWGPGHDYEGPRDREIFVSELTRHRSRPEAT